MGKRKYQNLGKNVYLYIGEVLKIRMSMKIKSQKVGKYEKKAKIRTKVEKIAKSRISRTKPKK